MRGDVSRLIALLGPQGLQEAVHTMTALRALKRQIRRMHHEQDHQLLEMKNFMNALGCIYSHCLKTFFHYADDVLNEELFDTIENAFRPDSMFDIRRSFRGSRGTRVLL